MIRAGAAMLSGQTLSVSADVKQSRLTVCLACPKMQPSADQTAHLCTVCGCWLDGQHLCKACLTTETCPENKWPKL